MYVIRELKFLGKNGIPNFRLHIYFLSLQIQGLILVIVSTLLEQDLSQAQAALAVSMHSKTGFS